MKTKHTQGPWHVECGDTASYICPTGRGGFIATVNKAPENTAEARKANAALIAAAPDLLAACEAAYLIMLKMPHDGLRMEAQSALCALRNVIANATRRDIEETQCSFEARAAIARAEGEA